MAAARRMHIVPVRRNRTGGHGPAGIKGAAAARIAHAQEQGPLLGEPRALGSWAPRLGAGPKRKATRAHTRQMEEELTEPQPAEQYQRQRHLPQTHLQSQADKRRPHSPVPSKRKHY